MNSQVLNKVFPGVIPKIRFTFGLSLLKVIPVSKSGFDKINMTRILIIFLALLFAGCVEEPVKEDVPELITRVMLTLTPTGGSPAIVVSAVDPDGEGVKDIAPEGAITLSTSTEYILSLSLINELADPTSPAYDITSEVEAEGDEHLFFYAWTNNIFSLPSGDGNIDNRSDAMQYEDVDNMGNPIGLITRWITGSSTGSGTFRVLLKHQPGIKSATSTSSEGETDLDLTFDLRIQ